MKIFSFILALFLGIQSVCAQDNQNFVLMVFGDSLSSGYQLGAKESFAEQLEKALYDKGYSNVTVLNQSRSGDTTFEGMQRLQNALTYRPDAVLLELGVNDALRGENIANIRDNLEKMIATFQGVNVPVLLIGMQVPPLKGAQYAADFAKMYTDLADKYDLVFYPFFMDGLFSGNLETFYDSPYLQIDRAHPTAEGVGIMVKRIMPTVQRFLSQFQ